MVWGKLIVLLLLLVPIAAADPISELRDEESKARIETSYFEKIDYIVIGKYASRIELLGLSQLKERNLALKSKPQVNDSSDVSGYLLLVGGPWHNSKTFEMMGTRHEQSNLSLGYVLYYDNAIAYSDRLGFNNAPRTNVYNSPLNNWIPFYFVPLAAAFIAVFLLWAGKFFGNLFHDSFNNIFSKGILKFLKKKELNTEYKGFKILGVRIKYREWVVIVISAVIFAIAISYTYYLNRLELFLILGINLMVNLFMFSFKNLIRLVMDGRFEMHTEYTLWPFGAFVTLFSGFLGNTFSVAGYTINDKNDRPIQGFPEFLSTFVLFILSIVFLFLNIAKPSLFNQMVFASALTGSFLMMLPIFPFDGKKIYDWNKSIWWLLFIPVLIVYLAMTVLLL